MSGWLICLTLNSAICLNPEYKDQSVLTPHKHGLTKVMKILYKEFKWKDRAVKEKDI